jgi:hypothetical protein
MRPVSSGYKHGPIASADGNPWGIRYFSELLILTREEEESLAIPTDDLFGLTDDTRWWTLPEPIPPPEP